MSHDNPSFFGMLFNFTKGVLPITWRMSGSNFWFLSLKYNFLFFKITFMSVNTYKKTDLYLQCFNNVRHILEIKIFLIPISSPVVHFYAVIFIMNKRFEFSEPKRCKQFILIQFTINSLQMKGYNLRSKLLNYIKTYGDRTLIARQLWKNSKILLY